MKAILIVMALGLVGCASKQQKQVTSHDPYQHLTEMKQGHLDKYLKGMREIEGKFVVNDMFGSKDAANKTHLEACGKAYSKKPGRDCEEKILSLFIERLFYQYQHVSSEQVKRGINPDMTYAELELMFREIHTNYLANEYERMAKGIDRAIAEEREFQKEKDQHRRPVNCTSTRYGDTVYTNCN